MFLFDFFFFFFKQKTAYEMRISDWSSDVCSSDLVKTLAGVRDVALGGKHSLILKTDDSLWACGSNEFGQLGNGGTRNAQTPVQIMDGVKIGRASCRERVCQYV